MSTVVTVENLGKKYRLSHQAQQQPYVALRDVIAEKASAIGRRLLHPFRSSSLASRTSEEDFWALKDVSFEINQGDRVGIIGRNGAGKSTLLKILSRIVEPTTGSVRLTGRVASLLEVGTGFHPELTGRENIFLNGAILGMGKSEIKKKFDEIVDFAEIEKFLDTPVKRYSSGMYVRLAFAVAAHLEPEILLVDEVLAVGDAQFQKKCLGKMEDVSTKEGRTVLFVSHNMAAISNLCTTVILLEAGRIKEVGSVSRCIGMYLQQGHVHTSIWKRNSGIPSEVGIFFEEVGILNIGDQYSDTLSSLDEFFVRVLTTVTDDIPGAQIAVRVTNQEGIPVLTTTNCDLSGHLRDLSKGRYVFCIAFPGCFLPPGRYELIVASFIPGVKLFDSVESSLSFQILDMGSHATSMRDGRLGVVTPILKWNEVRLGS